MLPFEKGRSESNLDKVRSILRHNSKNIGLLFMQCGRGPISPEVLSEIAK